MDRRYLASSGLDEKLIRAVVRQFGGWESFKTSAHDVTNHGIDGGFGGWIYYTETCEFYVRNRKAIMQLVKDEADAVGEGTFKFIMDLRCIKNCVFSDIEVAESLFGRPETDGSETVRNCLAWLAAEEVCRDYVSYLEDKEEE